MGAEDWQAAFRSAIRLFDIPVARIDAKTILTEDLRRFGLPARPDPTRQPALFALWVRMLDEPLRILRPTFDFPMLPQRALPRLIPAGRVATPQAGRGGRELSNNWSGAFVTARSGERLTQVWGRWHVPGAARPAGALGRPPGGEYQCSCWVGLDGHRRNLRGLPQAGVAVSVPAGGGTASAFAWQQWWLRDAESPPVKLDNLPVQPGDEIICNVAADGPGEVRFHIKNQTTGDYVADAWDASGKPPVAGQAANWIVESPMILGSTQLFVPPEFSQVTFDDCTASARGHDGTMRPDHTLSRATRVFMYQRLHAPRRTAVVARPKVIGPGRLEVSYQRPA